MLAEADRIPEKHLATLEPGISDNQTNEMSSRGLTLVLPRMIHETFSDRQRQDLMTIRDFIDFVREKQTPRS